jgi:uncharacterized protein
LRLVPTSPSHSQVQPLMDTPIQVDLGRIAQDLQIRRVQVESVVQLLDEGNTVPFITRYRKERTGNLNEMVIREIQARVTRLRELAARKQTILKTIEAQGKLTEELAAAIRAADNPKRLEDLYLPFKPKKRTKATEAREKGLEPLALAIWNRDETLTDLRAAAESYLNPEKELDTVEKVLEGVGHILAEAVSELANVRDAVRRVLWKTGKIVTTKADNIPEGQGLEYRDYFHYSEPLAHIPPHRVLAINRGDKEGPLKVKVEIPRAELEGALLAQLPLEGHPHAEIFSQAALDALDRLLLPSLEREARRDLTEMAERHAVDVFARNLRSLLLQPPIPKQTVLAIDPGFRTGCKLAVLDSHGNLLDHGVIHPHPPQNRRYEAKLVLKDLVGKYQIGVVAIGNGTACRETEELIAEIIAEGTQFHQAGRTAPAAASAPAEAEPAAVSAASPAPAAEAAPGPSQEQEPAAEAPTPPPTAEASTPEPSATTSEPAAEPTPEPVAGDGATSSPTAEANHAVPESAHPAPEPALPPISGGAPDADEEFSAQTPPAPPPPEALFTASEAATPAAPIGTNHEPLSSSDPPPAAEAPSETPIAEPASQPPTALEATAQTPAAATTPSPSEVAVTAESPAAPPEPGPPPAALPTEAEAPGVEEMVVVTPFAGGKPPAPGPKTEQHRPPRPPKAPPPPPAPHPADAQLAQLAYVIVNEAGASVYSTSPIGREEFPDHDATLRSAISIGRRLQDPLAELVKIEPQNIGVGLYQHDVNPKQLKESLESVIESCVNFVGVDLNTASAPLLRHVSGLNQLTARRLVEYRKEKGPITNRQQLLQVEGIGPATFTQAAGFLKIREGDNPLDRTWVHPESYPVAEKLLERLGFTAASILDRDQLSALRAKLAEVDVPALARELQVGEPTLRDILDALARPDRDPREDLPKPIFKKGVLKLEDLQPGMELKGTVLNVVDFGAFVDIGLKDSGLVHISQLANRYIKSPHDVVSVGDVVTVWVMGVDKERKRVSLTMVAPGTERTRGGGGRRPQGDGRNGGERRGGGRGPRREGHGGPPAQREAAAQPAPAGAPAGEGGGGTEAQGGGAPRRAGPPPRGPRGGPGPRPPHASARSERSQAPRPLRPSKPSPPPPPLSKDALTGNVPLRTFGQLKQLWQARAEMANEPAEPAPPTPEPAEPAPAPATEEQAPPPTPDQPPDTE